MAGEMNYSLSDLRAAVGDGDGFGGNNGFIWLLLLWAMMGGNWNGNRYGCGEFLNKVGVDAASANQIEDLSRQVTQDALRGAIAGNHDAIDALSKQLCCSTADITAAISGVNTAMLQGFNGIERLVQNCCCEVKTLMLQGFNGVDKTLCSLNTNMLQGFSSVNTSVERGFASTAFETQKQTCEILKNQDKNTDRILDWLNANKQSELEEKLSLARVEISQRNQTDAIFERLRNSHNGCNGCNGCGGIC